MATCVSREYKDSAVGIGEGKGDDEFLITRIQKFRPALTIVNCYGEQRKTTNEEVVAKWNRLRKELEAIRMRKDFCVLTGDLNKLVGCDDLGVPGNNPELSKGGKLLREMLATKDWVLVNSLGAEVVEGGPYTRVDPATSKLSCLDLFIVSRELRPYIKNLLIDSKRKWKIARSVRSHGRVIGVKPTFKLIYSDHFPVLLTLTDLPKVDERKEEKEVRWNLAREGGWKKYEILSNQSENKLKDVVANEEISIEEVKHKFDKVHDKVCFKAFGKVTIFKGFRQNTTVIDNVKKNKPEGEVARILQEEEDKRAAEEIEEIKKSKPGKVGRVWEVRKRIVGGKKASHEATSVINPKTGKLALSKEEIKVVSLEYCRDTLKNNTPEPALVNHIEQKKLCVKDFLNLTGGNFCAKKDTFDFIVSKFKKSGKRNYDFLTKSGKQFQDIVFKFCQRMFKYEVFPNSFQETTLHMIFKGGIKGRREILADNRFIHSKDWFSRTAEALVVEDGLKQPLLKGSSIYQIGGQPRLARQPTSSSLSSSAWE